ncbi:MAG TPA: ATP-binding cassette domain-containing protein [Acidimicrobiales bacterium]|nr:ATP-binding cassette domain-containing protein [Acidimicrobiales bacterium]
MITFEHVSKRYEDGTLAVDDLSLECATGEITVLVGSSGCGKTTSLRMINRLVEPTSGTVSVDGRDVRRSEPAQLRRGMGYVIQHGGLFPHRTILDNIATVPRLLGSSRSQARDRARELMDLVGLEASMGRRYPHQLSGGQQQRVGVARALAADPPILLMDEPFSAVDPVVRGELQQELLRLQDQLHKTIVFVTHDIEEAVKLGDRIAVMRTGGRLVQFDTPERVLADPADPFVERFLGVDRGVRWLSFVGSDSVALRPPATVRPDAPREELQAAGEQWVLVVDEGHHPVGWREAAAGDGRIRPIGHTFCPGTDSVRAALDALVLSPAGLAVAVDGTGLVLGVAGYEEITKAITGAGGRA